MEIVNILRLDKVAENLKRFVGDDMPVASITLGSGLGKHADRFEILRETSYADLELPSPGVEGHSGILYLARISGQLVFLLSGRVHLYEGHPVQDVVLAIRAITHMGVKTHIITNAAGGIDPGFNVSDLVVIRDHINQTGKTPLLGLNNEDLGTRFPDQSTNYDTELLTVALDAMKHLGLPAKTGIYAGKLGPEYETPAEVKILEILGAHMVGMSTVLEVIAAIHMGARILGLTCISNAAAGLSDKKLSHKEVQEAAEAAAQNFINLITEIMRRLPLA